MTPRNPDQTEKNPSSHVSVVSTRTLLQSFFLPLSLLLDVKRAARAPGSTRRQIRCKSARLLLMGLCSATYPDANFYNGASHIRFRASLSHFSGVISVRCHFQAAIFFSSSFYKIRTISGATDKGKKMHRYDRGKRKKLKTQK